MGDAAQQILAVIPARWASSRFPGKPLAMIAGKPMLQWVWQRVQAAPSVDAVAVATDDERIVELCNAYGVDVVMTSPDHETGTDRLAEVAAKRPARLYVNVQGDEPLIDPAAIDAVARCLDAAISRGIGVSTAYIEGATPEQEASPSSVHLVPTLDGCVLTFSRLPIPLSFREAGTRNVHVGLYAFTGDALRNFSQWERGPVERAESIELMRFLEHGQRIACTPIAPGSIGVDHPEDIPLAEAALRARGEA
ncbi:3-deoxy-manno-octulosonate cytidylyltransferase [Magnetofaba australis]|uniref:Putative 3-deoxy-D-manno-octulosonate cytidylyltransferase n=1 Tax=Magnetofaba australis IT-1 TaxID=1434232 RepID=A0A1Y2K4Z3_9PROT|nr:3-deoxy-manno-octulosonate cytidylyltransferase [Magnetofaba australis]OSM04437.1 putative 3-deoxy-D-manno-octulosonate cytidylyltransferase [Magnetofaba australis IT-1]